MAEWNLLPHEEAKLLNVARDEALIEPTPGMMRGVHRLAAAARRVLASADSQGLIRLDESGDVASELRSALAAATEAKP